MSKFAMESARIQEFITDDEKRW